MKTLILSLLALASSTSAHADGACKMPVCQIVADPTTPWEHVLQINGITFQHESVMGVGVLVNDVGSYERHGVCKAIYPEGY